MRIFTNQKIKTLFHRIMTCILVFTLTSIAILCFQLDNTVVYIFICSLCMALGIITVCYSYFKKQTQIIENATLQITEYLSGNKDARIECDDEGALFKLFHRVNTLASTLNAHAEKEEKAKEFLKRTISDISHQLKTPLTALNIYNGIMKEEAENLPTMQEFILSSEQELDRIETLVQNLLKITKLDAGTIIFEKKREDLSEIMKDVEKYFSFRAKQEEKELTFTGDTTIQLLCDRDWLIEAINNIVKNALDHTEKGEYVHIQWKQLVLTIQIIIRDSGSGIYPEDLYYIFKRFYRSRFSKDTQGIGLGLSLAKSIIEAHNGTIEVNSELGKGTIFTINFLIPTKL